MNRNFELEDIVNNIVQEGWLDRRVAGFKGLQKGLQTVGSNLKNNPQINTMDSARTMKFNTIIQR